MCNGTEDCSTCSSDCGACTPVVFCGDGACNGSESCSNCSSDCGVCAPPSLPPPAVEPPPSEGTGGVVESISSAVQNVTDSISQTVSNATQNITENISATVEIIAKAVANISPKQIKEAAKAAKEAVSTPATQATAEAVVGVATAVAVGQGVGSLFAQIPAISDIFLIIVRGLGLIAEFLGIKKRTKKWGVVYDAQTKRPLDPAYVTIYDAQGKEIESKVTDMDGRFGFLVGSGAYKMVAHKTNYAFPATTIAGTSDDLYDSVYKGELIEINNPDILKLNIPMDPVGVDWNEQIKKKIMSFNPKREILLKRLSSILFWIGLIISPIIYWAVPSTLNLVILTSYLVLAGLRTVGFKARNYGRVYDKETGTPIPFAKIKVLLRIPGLPEQRLLTAVADVTGRYYILVVGKGGYILNITGTTINGRQVSTEVPVDVKERVINFDINV